MKYKYYFEGFYHTIDINQISNCHRWRNELNQKKKHNINWSLVKQTNYQIDYLILILQSDWFTVNLPFRDIWEYSKKNSSIKSFFAIDFCMRCYIWVGSCFMNFSFAKRVITKQEVKVSWKFNLIITYRWLNTRSCIFRREKNIFFRELLI